MLGLFPDTAQVRDGDLAIAGVAASDLADEFGTPLVAYCEATVRARARAYREAAPDALVVYGAKAFQNVALMRIFAAEGLGADVSTLGELAYAARAGIPGERLVVHGNNKSDEELRAAAEAGAGFVVVDSLEEVGRAADAGIQRVLIRVTPGIDVDTHVAIQTGQLGSKFGLAVPDALTALAEARGRGLDVAGLHVHLGSQLRETAMPRMTVLWLGAFAARCQAELGWTPAVINLGGGLGVSYLEEERAPAIGDFVGALLAELDRAWHLVGLERPQLILEPGRSLVAQAGVTLYRVGTVKQATESQTYVAVDGGMSDNPRPLLYGARYRALVANRADAEPTGTFSVAGKHCESGDVLIESVALAEPRRGDVLAVPVTGAYTLGMGSNYNAVPRPAAVLVSNGEARLIRRRETLDDLLALEAD